MALPRTLVRFVSLRLALRAHNHAAAAVTDWALHLARRAPGEAVAAATSQPRGGLLPETPAVAYVLVAARLWFGLGTWSCAVCVWWV
jgi:hypothetical protein